jgi:ribosome maturation factor RimP
MKEDAKKKIKNLINKVLWDKNIHLVRLELKGSEAYSILRIFIDKPGGVTVEDCVLVSRELSDLFDIEEPIDHRYTLEVSSPGIDINTKKKKGK